MLDLFFLNILLYIATLEIRVLQHNTIYCAILIIFLLTTNLFYLTLKNNHKRKVLKHFGLTSILRVKQQHFNTISIYNI